MKVVILSPIKRRFYPKTNIADGTRYVRVKLPPKVSSFPYTIKFRKEYCKSFIMGKWKCFSVLLRWSFILAYPKFVCFRCKNKVTTENLYRSIVSRVSRMGRRVFELVERKWGRGRRRSVGRGEWGERRGLRKEKRNRNGRNAEKRACSRRLRGNKWRREDFETSSYKF